jgi:uncharacterized lipoprotein YehR (DUF1307 family)
VRRTTIVAVVLAIALTACGKTTRTTNYHDFETGVSVSIECDYDKFGGSLLHDSCKVHVLDDGL